MSKLVPFGSFGRLGRPRQFGEMGEWMDNFFRSSDMASFPVDVQEEDNKYVVTAELPGLHREMIDVSVDNGILTIRTNQEEEKRVEKENYILNERRSGMASRSFTLENVKEEDVSAEYKDGVLTIVLPKTSEQKPKGRRIEID